MLLIPITWIPILGANPVVVIENTISLNHFDGTDGATSSPDQVPGITWTFTGTAQLDTAQQKFGSASLLIPAGINDIRSNVVAPLFNRAGNWTAEVFFRYDSVLACIPRVLFSGTIQASGMQFRPNEDGDANSMRVVLINSAGTFFWSPLVVTPVPINTWHHMAVVKESTTYSFYFNGVRLDSLVSSELIDTPDQVFIDNIDGSGNVWFEEFRVSKTARYSGVTYTVPTAPFTVD